MSCVSCEYGVVHSVFLVGKNVPQNSCLPILSSALVVHSLVCAVGCLVVLKEVCKTLLKTRSGLIWVKKKSVFETHITSACSVDLLMRVYSVFTDLSKYLLA